MAEQTKKERPILFSGAMVRAILEGRKVQTRRVITPQPPGDRCSFGCVGGQGFGFIFSDRVLRKCPYGHQPGDRIWVREAHAIVPRTAYRMSDDVEQTLRPDNGVDAAIYREGWELSAPRWRPSIHMPRWASRITLDITDVRVERVKDITTRDCIREGIEQHEGQRDGVEREQFRDLWDSINDSRGYPWESNPWVWVVSFATATTPEGE